MAPVCAAARLMAPLLLPLCLHQAAQLHAIHQVGFAAQTQKHPGALEGSEHLRRSSNGGRRGSSRRAWSLTGRLERGLGSQSTGQ